VLFGQYNARLEAKLPLTYDVMLRYKGPLGKKEWEHPYRLDLQIYLGSQEPPKGLPELVTEVENIRKELQKWRGGTRGLLVEAIDRRRHSAESGAAIMCASCAARAQGRWRDRCGIGRYGASGSASHSAPAPDSGRPTIVSSHRDAKNQLDVMYASVRLRLPFDGVLLFGY
jgi:hypothetical protein